MNALASTNPLINQLLRRRNSRRCWIPVATLMTSLWWGLQALGAEPAFPVPQMTFLDNGEVRVGLDLALGGAVTFLSGKDYPGNLINSADLGRQIQMSHYSGPWPFEVGEKKPHPHWVGLGWNPIQTGDCRLNPSRILEHRNDGHELYVKCIPMQWPLDNVPGDCLFETWTTLDGPMIHMRFRCTNQREDQTSYRPCAQELPAVYTISKLSRLMSYTGDQPFTSAALTHVRNDWRKDWPWTRFTATERWAALVDDTDWGLGVFKDDGGEFHGGIYGDDRSADPKHGSTAYVAPIHREHFDHNIIYEHRTAFTVGHLEEIRRRFNAMATTSPPAWRFETDRQHWTLHRASDEGFPLNGAWRIRFGDQRPRLEGPTQCWRAAQSPEVEIEIGYQGPATQGRILWKGLGADHYETERSLTFDLVPAEAFRTYRLDLSDSPGYRGLITGLAFEPVAEPIPGGQIVIRSIRFLTPPHEVEAKQ